MRRIALVGTASSGVRAPFSDPDWLIWGVSSRGAHVTRADRWFELHRLSGEPQAWADRWRQDIRKFSHDCELVMMYPEPDLGPKVTQYPYERIVQRFGTFFMTSTFSWMMALAIDEMLPRGGEQNPGEIAIYGVEMEYGTEYESQRHGLRHFMALAEQLGIAVTRLADGGLAYDPVPYPMWQDDPLLSKLAFRRKQTRDNIEKFNKSLHVTQTMIAQNKAVIGAIQQSKTEGYDADQRLRELERETEALMQTSAKLSKDLVYSQGSDDEQSWLSGYLAP